MKVKVYVVKMTTFLGDTHYYKGGSFNLAQLGKIEQAKNFYSLATALDTKEKMQTYNNATYKEWASGMIVDISPRTIIEKVNHSW